MTTITRSVEINALRDAVRPYYAHPVHTPQWSHRLYLWEPDEAWPSAGTNAKMGIKSAGVSMEGLATTLTYDDKTMAHHFRLQPSNMTPMEFWFTFDEGEGKTTVTMKVDYTIPGSYLGQALDKLYVERQNTRDIEQQLANLKALVEDNA